MRRVSAGTLTKAILMTLPVAYVVFDFAENGIVLALLASFPDRMPILAGMLPYVTVVKRAASLLSLSIPILILIVVLIRRPRAG